MTEEEAQLRDSLPDVIPEPTEGRTVRDLMQALQDSLADAGRAVAAKRLAEWVDGYRDQLGCDSCVDALAPDRGWLLVEESTLDDSIWLTTHESPEDAASYWESQDCREDWDPLVLVNLASGASFAPVVGLRFEPAGTIDPPVAAG